MEVNFSEQEKLLIGFIFRHHPAKRYLRFVLFANRFHIDIVCRSKVFKRLFVTLKVRNAIATLLFV
ncbi:hypothetical protein CEV33_3563 [Brucella grignonensis]|uniref:Uncharacterized protein n=1 Tax=Brucella grignonensis TaxID=94627 RepID=A0A256EZ99_9HYPH|nr:hypothetical protein CEV33_3563 [Brucella grignonensis]